MEVENKKTFEELITNKPGVSEQEHLQYILAYYKIILNQCIKEDKDKLKNYLLEQFHKEYMESNQVFSYIKKKLSN